VPEYIIDKTLDAEFDGLVCEGIGIPCPNGEIFFNPSSRLIDKQAALFGEANLSLTPTLKLTAGARVSDVSYSGSFYLGGAFLGTPLITSSASATEHPVTPKAVLTWQPGRDELLYASATKGYRVGGINTDVGAICGADLTTLGIPVGADGIRHVPTTYSSDSLWSYEIGAKNDFLDRRLEVNTSLYWIDWSNIQQNVYLPSCGNEFVANLGTVRSRGGDIELRYRPSEPLVLSVSASYTKAAYTEASCAGALGYNGTDCVGSPGGTPVAVAPIVSAGDALLGAPWRFVSSIDYSLPKWGATAPYFHADYVYTSAQTALLPGQDTRNALYDTTIPSLPITSDLDLRTGLRWSGFDLSLFAQNVTNSHPILYESRDVPYTYDDLYFAHTWRPRTIGMTGIYRF